MHTLSSDPIHCDPERNHSPAPLGTIAEVEAYCLAQPQVGVEVVHHFGPGIYIRECRIKAGVFVTGHIHRFAHLNQMLAGRILMSENGSEFHEVKAPHRYQSEPGQKMGQALEDVVWQNIYATTITDVEELERWLFKKSAAFLDCAAKVRDAQAALRKADQEDFFMVLDEFQISPYQARAESEREDDQVPMPAGYHVMIRPSAIEGSGVFLQVPANAGDPIAPARISGKRTPVGRYTNHSRTPNAKFVEIGGDAILVATARIEPYSRETVPGDEITVDYRQVRALAGRLK